MNNKEKILKSVIILFGPPGAGKGVQAELLAERLGLYRLEVSKLLEQKFKFCSKNDFIKIKNEKIFLFKEKQNWLTGKLCSTTFVNFCIKEKIKKLVQEEQGMVIEGAPRSIDQAQEIIPLLEKLYGKKNITVIFIEISPEQTLWRNSHRRICSLMRHSILYSKENAKLKYCILDGSKLIKRKGLDDLKTIKIRLEEYKEKSLPIAQYLKQQGIKIKKINGDQSVENVLKDILKALRILN